MIMNLPTYISGWLKKSSDAVISSVVLTRFTLPVGVEAESSVGLLSPLASLFCLLCFERAMVR